MVHAPAAEGSGMDIPHAGNDAEEENVRKGMPGEAANGPEPHGRHRADNQAELQVTHRPVLQLLQNAAQRGLLSPFRVLRDGAQ